MHDGMLYDPIQGHGQGHNCFKATREESTSSPARDKIIYSARNARIASAVLAAAIPSVCHTPVLCQNDGT